jgi:hypothetical protein
MLNEVIISGVIEKVHNIGDFILAAIRTNGDIFYLFFDSQEYDYSTLEKQYVCAKGYLQHIKYKLEKNVNAINVLAICVEEMEKCNI